MKTELTVALVAGAVALASAAGTLWSSIRNAQHTEAIEQLKIDNDKLKLAAQREKEIANFREPLARAAYDLQSRIFNILEQNFITVYLVNGNEREKAYVINNTAFLMSQYMCWTELVRREIQFIDLGSDEKTRELLTLQDGIYKAWGTDLQSRFFRVFSGEQRAIGEAMIRGGLRGPECMGYLAFQTTFVDGVNPLVDDLRADVVSLGHGLDPARDRLTNLQHGFIDLLKLLDPDYIRFPKEGRSKV